MLRLEPNTSPTSSQNDTNYGIADIDAAWDERTEGTKLYRTKYQLETRVKMSTYRYDVSFSKVKAFSDLVVIDDNIGNTAQT